MTRDTVRVLIANGIGVVAVALFVFSYQRKTRRGIVACNICSRGLYVVQYLLLWALEGAALDVPGMLVATLAQNKDKPLIQRHRRLFMIGSLSLVAVMGAAIAIWRKNPFGVLPILGVLLQSGSFWLNREKHIRIVSLIGAPFWMAYNFISMAYVASLGDLLTFLSIAIALLRYDILKKHRPDTPPTEEK